MRGKKWVGLAATVLTPGLTHNRGKHWVISCVERGGGGWWREH